MLLRNVLIGCICFVLILPLGFKAYADTGVKLAGNADMHHISRPDSHASIGVMGEHVHKKGEWMLSYRYKFMRMTHLRDGHRTLDTAEALRKFMVTPTDMNMQMHMLGLMAAPSDHLTLMAMLPIMRKDMDLRNRMGVSFSTHAQGVGDPALTALIPLFERKGHRIHLNAGMSFPLGSINEKGDLPTGKGKRLPFPMQLGSGTWDFLPGITYNGQTENWSWGAQSGFVLRPGRNKVGYSLGNRYRIDFWGARKWSDWISTSLGYRYEIWQNVGGEDRAQNPIIVPTAEPHTQGGKRIDVLGGINLIVPRGPLQGQRLAFEAGFPVMQSLDGPQLAADWYFTVGWQAAFGPSE